MKQPNKKKYIIILLIVVIGLPVTYAFINILASDNTEETDAGCFEVNYNGEVLSASSLISTTDYLEGTHSQITLSVNDNCEVYETGNILVHTNEETTAPLNDTQALKYKVMSNNEEISTGTITKGTDVILATVPLTTTETIYDIYIWVDKDISQGAYNGTTYSGYIYATSNQTATIK